jgi:hypothetical protein
MVDYRPQIAQANRNLWVTTRRRARAEAQAQVKAEQDRIAQFWDDLTPAEQGWIRSEAIASADKFFHSRARVARFGVATAWTATRLSTAALAALSHPWPSRLDPRQSASELIRAGRSNIPGKMLGFADRIAASNLPARRWPRSVLVDGAPRTGRYFLASGAPRTSGPETPRCAVHRNDQGG